MESCFSTHTPRSIPTRQQPVSSPGTTSEKEAAISSRSTPGDDGDKPKVASWRCYAASQRDLGVLGPWGNAPNGSSRAEGPERLADIALS